MKLKAVIICLILSVSCIVSAATTVKIDDPETWTCSDVNKYVGQTVTFSAPFYICNNYTYTQGRYSISPTRIFSPTNQALPKSQYYNWILSHNSATEVTLSGINDYHRMGEKIYDLTVKINSVSNWTFVSGRFVGNTRQELLDAVPQVNTLADNTLLVCAFNLEYYLVDNLGTGYGPDNKAESDKQHTKIMQALTRIKADIFGFVEIEQGQSALKKLAESLTKQTGRQYSYINDGRASNGSYTKAGYVYCTQTVEPVGGIRLNNTQSNSDRKMMQAFREKQTGETFIYSINHFKAKSGANNAQGSNTDQGDGQGVFNASRLEEAKSVINYYNNNSSYYDDEDILIMGDLNAYAKEDPIMWLVDNGMTDLHRYFHADSSYSYVYHNQAGYLDHALANATMLKQITGMQAYHINSDEHDKFTYDKSSDLTMFRSSDHDPILVGLRLGAATDIKPLESFEYCDITVNNKKLTIHSAQNGYYRIFNLQGMIIREGNITEAQQSLNLLNEGFYIVNVYVEQQTKQFKIMIL